MYRCIQLYICTIIMMYNDVSWRIMMHHIPLMRAVTLLLWSTYTYWHWTHGSPIRDRVLPLMPCQWQGLTWIRWKGFSHFPLGKPTISSFDPWNLLGCFTFGPFKPRGQHQPSWGSSCAPNREMEDPPISPRVFSFGRCRVSTSLEM